MYIYGNISQNSSSNETFFTQKVVDKIRTHILHSVFFSRKSWHFLENVEKCCRTEQATDENVIGRIRDSILMPDNWSENTDTHSYCLIRTAVPQLQYYAKALRCYVACLVIVCIQLTPCSLILLEKLMVSRLFRTFCVYYGIQTCITVFRRACHLPLSRPRSIKSPAPSNFLKTHFNIIAQSTRSLPSGSVPSGFPTKTVYAAHLFPIRATCPSNLILDVITRGILGKLYRLWSCPLDSLLLPPLLHPS